MKICIVGAGWYGCHLAYKLSRKGYSVTLIDKNTDVLMGISGAFGIRLHAGPHYPRSKKTRESCHRAYAKFIEEYPELVEFHAYAYYALGNLDSDDLPSKVNTKHFASVCQEAYFLEETYSPSSFGYNQLHYMANIEEPSIVVGDRLRSNMKKKLASTDIDYIFNSQVISIKAIDDIFEVTIKDKKLKPFDYVVNTTSYKDTNLFEKNKTLPFVPKYQPCLALEYQEKVPFQKKPFSFIVMDGLFPCIMPYLDGTSERTGYYSKYIMTHGKWTILGSFDEVQKAEYLLNSLTEDDIQFIRRKCEAEINRFWPEFLERFKYNGWKGRVLAKLLTNAEFRSAVTYQDMQHIIHVIPGKVTNVFDVEEEVISFIERQNIKLSKQEEFSYIEGGVLDDAITEISEKPDLFDRRNTCQLQTYQVFKPNFEFSNQTKQNQKKEVIT